MKKFFLRNFILLSFFAILIPLYSYLDFNFPYQNNFFPWDSNYYAKLAHAFKNNLSLPEVNDPWGYRLLFPFIIGKISANLDLSLLQSGITINLISIFFTLNLFMNLCEKYNVNIFYYLFIILVYLLYWNGQFRHTLLLGGYSFAFDTFCISIYLYCIYKTLIYENKSYEILSYFLSIIFILQRPIVILFIPIFVLIFFTFLNRYKISSDSLNYKNKFFLFIIIALSCVTFIISKILIDVADSGYSALHMILTSIQFNLNLSDFLYIFYYALGPIFLYFLTLLFFKKKIIIDQLNKKKLPLSYKKKQILNLNYILIGLFFTLIGGADSDRFLLWFIVFLLLPFTIHSEKVFKKNKIILIFFILISFLWTRFYVPSMPPLSFSKVFESNNHVQTNYDDKLFYGPKFIKNFKYPSQQITIDDKKYSNIYLLKDQKIVHSVTFPINQYCLSCKWYYRNSQVQPYKYRISDLPIPIGYIHNQRNALIDHPKAGHRMIRFIYVIQWLFIQIFIIYLFKRYRIFK